MDRGEATKALDEFGIDRYVDAIVDGTTMTGVAKNLGVARSTLLAWLSADRDRAQRSLDARRLSAAAFDDMALQMLLDAKDAVEITRAREVASHLRWRASKMDVAQYGDKVGIGAAAGMEPLVPAMSNLEVGRRIAFIFELAKREVEEQASPPPQIGYTPRAPKVQDYWPAEPEG